MKDILSYLIFSAIFLSILYPFVRFIYGLDNWSKWVRILSISSIFIVLLLGLFFPDLYNPFSAQVMWKDRLKHFAIVSFGLGVLSIIIMIVISIIVRGGSKPNAKEE
ncbi:MAG: hypothetical protein ACE5KZ_07105 [Candidatus Scalinduaceae bacterium]